MVFPAPSGFVLFWVVVQIHFSIAATCTQPDWEWSRNLFGQDPCAVAEILEAKCKNLTLYDLKPLRPGTNYLTPQLGVALGCSCNTVTYSLYQACSQCQIPESGNTWTFYHKFCTEVYVTQIPLDIPDDTQVPPWAYLDVTKEDNFNLTTARAVIEDPSSSGLPPLLEVSSNSTDPAVNNTGAIVGGVVGGIAIIALSIVFILFWLRRTKPTNQGKVRLKRRLPPQVEESLLSPGPPSPPTVTRDLPKNATYRELSRSGVMTAYDSSFYPKNTIAPSRNGYHGFAEV